jgi:ferric enterobactin receptor
LVTNSKSSIKLRWRRTFVAVVVLLSSGFNFLAAQQQPSNAPSKNNLGIVAGNIISPEGKAIAYASLQLQLITDTTLQKQMLTDKNGSFEFEGVAFGVYRLKVKAVGYANYQLDSISIRAERYDFNLGDVKLKPTNAALDEVVVYAEKPLIENKDGKITYNVGESALSGASTTAELLKNMPLVTNDPNGKILLKGKEPKILIDDKPTDLTADQLKDLLESLPGSSIEKIELMTNPPAQYATETGGVINIVTKKGKIGWTGRVNMNVGTRGEGAIGINASYRNKKFSFNTTLGVGASQITGNSYSRRTNIFTDSSNYFNTDGSFKNKNVRPNLRTQVDYEFNKHSSVNFVYQGNLNYFNNNSTTQYTNINKNFTPYKLSTRNNGSDGLGYNHGVTATYTYKAKNPLQVLRVIAMGNWGKNENDKDFYQQFLNATFIPTSDSTQTQFFDNYNNNVSLRLNYDMPLKWKRSMFSTGATYQAGSFHNKLNTSFLRKSDSIFIPNDLLSNDFKFRQNIFTIRAAVTFTIDSTWRLTAGAQAEHTFMDFDFIKGNSINVANDYWNLLPNLILRKDFTREINASLVYRASIRRPGIGELNPNIDYSDPYNLRFGNPYLQPQLADNFDLNFSYFKGKYYFNTSLGYNKVKDVFNSIRTLVDNGNKTQITYQNISDRNEYEASIWGGYTFSKKFRINTSMGYTYNQYGEAEKLLYKYRDGGTFYTSFNYSFTPTNVLTFEGNARFSSFADPQGRSRSNLNMNLGVQRKFFNRRLSVSFNAIDPFRVQQFTTYTYGSNFSVESFNSTNTRNFRIAVRYQLNKTVKSKLSDKQKKQALDKLKQKQLAPLKPVE